MRIHVRAPISMPLCLSSHRAGFVNLYSSVRVRPEAPAFACRLRRSRPIHGDHDVTAALRPVMAPVPVRIRLVTPTLQMESAKCGVQTELVCPAFFILRSAFCILHFKDGPKLWVTACYWFESDPLPEKGAVAQWQSSPRTCSHGRGDSTTSLAHLRSFCGPKGVGYRCKRINPTPTTLPALVRRVCPCGTPGGTSGRTWRWPDAPQPSSDSRPATPGASKLPGRARARPARPFG